MSQNDIVIKGYCKPGFEAVSDAFEKNFKDCTEIGAATAVMLDGEMVVDIWAGYKDEAKTRPWEEDTIVQVMSTTKGIVSLVAHQLVEQGVLDLDAPVARYWPEFAQAGKEEIPVRYLLTHQSGLPAIDVIQVPGASADWDLMTKMLAEQAPRWEPGTKFGYQAITFGWLVGEVLRRITGKSAGQLIQEYVAKPFDIDFLLGFGPEYDDQAADVIDAPPAPPGVKDIVSRIMEDLDSVLAHAFVPSMPDPAFGFNSRVMRAAELPASNGHTNARGLAKIYGTLACGGVVNDKRLIGSKQLEIATAEQVNGIDVVTEMEWHIALGFLLALPFPGNTLRPGSFGHSGYGGSVGLADPGQKMGFGYVMNQLGWLAPFFTRPTVEGVPDPDPRAERILKAVYASL
jgi:CubicO group peptidase (beta-lactamase class C family)